jgi:hypothetical protein
VATRGQLVEAALATACTPEGGEGEKPELPWHPIDGPRDASTMWYTVLHKKERGVFIGLLCIRHGDRLASLLERGWTEVPIEDIGP